MPDGKHQPMLPHSELPGFFEKLSKSSSTPTVTNALELLMLTVLRSTELRGALIEEFNLTDALWEIPAKRMKGGKRKHAVPLSRQAIEIVEKQMSFAAASRSKLLFPSSADPKKPISENTLNKLIGALGYKGIATAHGMRALFSTTANKAHKLEDAIEVQLAHVPKNKVRAAYNHHDYLDERRELLQWWADHLDVQRGISKGSNVVPLARRKKQA